MKKNEGINNLRFFVVLLVVLHHAILAYNTYLFYTDVYLVADVIPVFNMINPVIDSSKFRVFDIIVGINDQFFMSLLFFVSGLFVWGSLKRKGLKTFAFARLNRLGIPLLVGVFVIIPIAYYPAVIQHSIIQGTQAVGFLEYYVSLLQIGLLSGPFWFIFVLIIFNLIVSLIFRYGRNFIEDFVEKSKVVFQNPFYFFIVILVSSIALYGTMTLFFDESAWVGKGVINFQTARILHYFLYFIMGVFVGIVGINQSFFAIKKHITYWLLWTVSGVGIFFLLRLSEDIDFLLISFLSATFTIGLTGLFFNYFNKKMIYNISVYSFGIYIYHYMFSSWLQLLLFDTDINGGIKGLIVFVLTLSLSLLVALSISRVRKIINN